MSLLMGYYQWLEFNVINQIKEIRTISKGFPCGADGKESTCNVGDLGMIPRLGRSPGGRHGNPLQYNCLENPYRPKNLVGHSPWRCKELGRTEQLSTSHHAIKGDILPALQVDCEVR